MLVKKSYFSRKISDYTEQNFIECNYKLEKTVDLFVTLGNTTNLKKRKKRKRKKIHSTVSKCFNLWQYGIGLRMSRIGQWPEIVMHDWKNPHLVTLVLLLAQASASRARFAGRNCKNPPKIEFKNSWNWRIILVPATIWQILNVKHKQSETEVMRIFRKSREITLGKLIFWWVFDI